MSVPIHQIEDKLFKQSLSDMRVAKEFFETHLAREILQKTDLSSLKLQPKSFIDEAFKNSEADIVYSTTVNGKAGYIYILSEHQSQIDDYMSLRLLNYCLRLIEFHRKKNPKDALPIVCPLVVYSGQKIWDATLDIYELFHDTDLARKTLLNPKLIDIHRLDDHEIKSRHWAGLTEFVLKYRKAHDSQLFEYLDEFFFWISNIWVQTEDDYVNMLIRFVMLTAQCEDTRIYQDMANKYFTDKKRGKIMTLADAFRREGRNEGILQGRNEGILQGRDEGISVGREEAFRILAKKLIARGDDFQSIAELTGLTISELEKIAQQMH